MNTSHKQTGFTLIEIALAILIIGLASIGLFHAFSQQFENTKFKESSANLIYSKKALLNFVQLNNYLPCPDTNNDGLEDRAGVACEANNGTLPYKNLGLTPGKTKDSWGNYIKYYTTQNVTDQSEICSTTPTRYSANYFCKINAPVYDNKTPPTATTTDSNNLTIYNAPGGTPIATQMSVVLVAQNSNGGAPCNTLSDDEHENCDMDGSFVQHNRTEIPFFDDELITISGYEIKRPQLFSSANFNGTPAFFSKFKDQHTAIANTLIENNQLSESGNSDEAAVAGWINRLIAEDRRLLESEKKMLYENKCKEVPTAFENQNNYTTLQQINNQIALNSSTIKPNLFVLENVMPEGIIIGGEENNSVFIEQNMYGTIQLGEGINELVVGGESAGDITTGDDKDYIRICGGAEQTTVSSENDLKPLIELDFLKKNATKIDTYKWKYENVAKNVQIDDQIFNIDSIVEINNYPVNFDGLCKYTWWGQLYFNKGDFCISTIDNESTGVKSAIQPVYRVKPGLKGPSNLWLDIKVTFYDHKTGNPIALPKLKATTLDMDGWKDRENSDNDLPKQFEYGYFYNTSNFTLDENTELRPYNKRFNYSDNDYIDENTVKVISSDLKDIGIPINNNDEPTYPYTMITTTYYNTNAFKYRIGLDIKEDLPNGVNRINSTWFKKPKYETEKTVTVGGTLNLGLGDDEILIGGNIDRDTYLGEGDNYAYFFSNSRQKVIGSDGDDNVNTLGDLGWPEPEPNSEGWDLKNGNNSVRILGSCYAPITLGSGNDLFIVAKNTERECQVITEDGDDTVEIDGTLHTLLNTGFGDDTVIINYTLPDTPTIQTESGNDLVKIQKLLRTSINTGAGNDTIKIFAGISDDVSNIDGGEGNDVLTINYTQSEWENSSIKSKITNIEKIILQDKTIYLAQ